MLTIIKRKIEILTHSFLNNNYYYLTDCVVFDNFLKVANQLSNFFLVLRKLLLPFKSKNIKKTDDPIFNPSNNSLNQ